METDPYGINHQGCFHRPEYLPNDPSNISSVYNYLKTRINTIIRSSLEYPAILPQITPRYLLFSEIAYLSNATAYYQEKEWKKLESRINKLIEQKLHDNHQLMYDIARETEEILHKEEKIELDSLADPQLSEARNQCVNLWHQIDIIESRKKGLLKEIKWLEKMKAQYKEDPRFKAIAKRKDKLNIFENEIDELENANNESLKQMMWNIKRKENELILIEGQIEATQSRIDMIGETLPPEEFNPYYENQSLTSEELALLEYSSTTED